MEGGELTLNKTNKNKIIRIVNDYHLKRLLGGLFVVLLLAFSP